MSNTTSDDRPITMRDATAAHGGHRICVIGAGYVGLVSASCLSELGHEVVLVEKDRARLDILGQGLMPLFEPGLEEVFSRGTRSGRLSLAHDYGEIRFCDTVIIAVNTPLSQSGDADTSAVFEAAEQVLENAAPGLTLVVKSTVPVGTGDRLEEMAAAHASGVRVVSNPEFLRQGTAIMDFLQPDRIVIGSPDPVAGEVVAGLYEGIEAPVIHCSRRSAEMAKYAANALLATRLSFINEIAAICDATSADVDEVGEIVGLDHRIGRHYLAPGLGWGGSCLPKDVQSLAASAKARGYTPRLLSAITAINEERPAEIVARLRIAGALRPGSTIAILGLSFKPNTDDLRGSPATRLLSLLLRERARLKAHDPAALSNARILFPGAEYCEDMWETVRDCDAVVLATEWHDYVAADWARIGRLMRRRFVFDGRNALDRVRLHALGFEYMALGRQGVQQGAGARPAALPAEFEPVAEVSPAPVLTIAEASSAG